MLSSLIFIKVINNLSLLLFNILLRLQRLSEKCSASASSLIIHHFISFLYSLLYCGSALTMVFAPVVELRLKKGDLRHGRKCWDGDPKIHWNKSKVSRVDMEINVDICIVFHLPGLYHLITLWVNARPRLDNWTYSQHSTGR